MSTDTSKWQILSFCNVLEPRYSFIGYATLSPFATLSGLIIVDTISEYAILETT